MDFIKIWGRWKMRFVKYKNFRAFLVVLAILLSANVIGGVLVLGSYDNAGGRPAEAAVTNDSAYTTAYPTRSGYYYVRFYVYIYADSTWGRPSISSSNITSSNSSTYGNFTWTNYKFSYNPRGYSWSSSAPTSFTCYYKTATDYTYNQSASTVASSLYNGSFSSSRTMTRSGNDFTYSSSYSTSVSSSNNSSYRYYYAVLVMKLDLQASYFTANKYTLYLDANGGTVSNTSLTATYNASVSLPTPSRTNYSFVGWYTGSTKKNSGFTWTYTSNQTFKAKWACTVSFNSMGGSECSNMTVNTDEAYDSLPTPTRTGYEFVGWYKTSNFSGDMIQTTDIVQENHTLYAKWNCSVVFDAVGGTACSSITVQVDSVYGTLPTTTRTGYTFDGWYKESNYSGSQVTSTDIITVGHTLYAKWLSTINLDQQGGSGGSGSVRGVYNLDMPEATAPSRMGYDFGGYFTLTNGSGTQYYSDNMTSVHIYDLSNGSTLYAKWTKAKYILYYNANGGTVSPTEQTVEFGSIINLITPTRAGYTFFGWYLDGSLYSGGAWTFTENKTVVAKWGYTLTYDANGGWVTPGSVRLEDGDTITTPIPTRLGCYFDGWLIGSTHYYGGVWAYSTNQTAVAKWVCELSYTLNDGAGGNITGSESGYYTAGTNITLTASPTAGYQFDYWLINGAKFSSATYTHTLDRHTNAVAYFKKSQPTANVYATNGTIASTYLNLEPETYSATLRITPETGKYIESISFDNVAFYTIDSWSTKLYAVSSFAQNVAYQANEGNNDLWLTFNYYNTNKSVNVYVRLTTTPYSDLTVPKNDGGALDGIAVSANYGGSVTLVGADMDTLADSDEIICTAKLAQPGYEFVGWCFADSPANIISTSESAKFKKSTIYGRQLMALFQPTATNPDYNMELDNND